MMVVRALASLRLLLIFILALAPLAAGLACNSGAPGRAKDGGAPDGLGDGGAPVSAPAGVWTWVDVPGTACDDGTMTGIAVNPSPDATSRELFVYFMGGGACWDASTCFVLNTSTHGPFGRAQWEASAAQIDHPLDRTRATNPFRAASYVFVPYCTGDLHGGSNVATYDVLGPRPFHHVGHLNLEAALSLVRATWPDATRVIVSGSSAGGFGATLNYDTIRRAYPAARIALVDDAGPFLEGSAIPPDQHANWNNNWHLDALVGPLCPSCQNDLSQIYPALAALYPSDRMALLSSLQDQVIRTYFLILLGADYEAKLRALIAGHHLSQPRFQRQAARRRRVHGPEQRVAFARDEEGVKGGDRVQVIGDQRAQLGLVVGAQQDQEVGTDHLVLQRRQQDQVIRTYFLILLGADDEAKLRALIADRLDPIPTFHTFLIPGESHTLLGTMDTTAAGGLTLEAWLGQMVTGAAAWTSVGSN